MTLFVTIPTRGDNPKVLEEIVNVSGLHPSHFVIVRTLKSAPVPEGVTVIDDFGEINIQRWWKAGIRGCVERGADNVVVANDDIEINGETFAILEDALRESGATVSCPGKVERHITTSRPLMRKLVGSLWVVNANHGLLPDERYRWYYGDDDLDIRARRQFSGIVTAKVYYNHLTPGAATTRSPELMRLLGPDLSTFRRQYPVDLAYRRMIERTQGRTGHMFRRILGMSRE